MLYHFFWVALLGDIIGYLPCHVSRGTVASMGWMLVLYFFPTLLRV